MYRHEGQAQVVAAGQSLDGDVESQEAEVEQTVLAQGGRELGRETVNQTQAVQDIRESELSSLAGIDKADRVVGDESKESLGLKICCIER